MAPRLIRLAEDLMRILTFFLLALPGAAFAVDTTVSPSTDIATLYDAIQNPDPGDVITFEPGFYVLPQPFVIDTNVTLRGEAPPREVFDQDTIDDVILWFDAAAALPTNPNMQGVFNVQPNVSLTFENIKFKMQEFACDDQLDNDGNGLSDSNDPACEQFYDTADTDVFFDLFAYGGAEVRAFNVNAGTLTVRDSIIQGWSFSVRGNAIWTNAGIVNIEGSTFVFNRGVVSLQPNGGYNNGEGTIFARSAELNISDSYFHTNEQRYGGAVYATAATAVNVTDTAFYQNAAEDGGALFIESSALVASRNFFVSNTANITPGDGQLWIVYEGGAIYSEDSVLDVRNNVFLRNLTFDWGAAVLARRNLSGTAPVFINNTFVENLSIDIFGGASMMFDDTSFDYRNNISVGESTGVVGAINWVAGTAPQVNYSDFHNVDPTTIFTADLAGVAVNQVTNLFEDPQFVYYNADAGSQSHDDWRIWRFWLDPASALVNAGDPDPSYDDVDGSRNDMGAYGGAQSGVSDDDGDGWADIYDCDDNNAAIFPYALEECDDVDNDCNGIVDDREITYWPDADLDGYGDADAYDAGLVEIVCPGANIGQPPGGGVWVTRGGDCDDTNVLVNPGRSEFCDEIDNDCDGDVDEGIPFRTHYLDNDGDGFGDGNPRTSIEADCPPPGFSEFGDDCDDTDSTVHPLITIDRQTNELLALQPLERNEADRSLAYVADGKDQDCDLVDLCYPDYDSDGYGAAAPAGQPPVYLADDDLVCDNASQPTASTSSDCDDSNILVYPGAIETPGDGVDQNCDGFDACYEDLDGDGWGSDVVIPGGSVSCDQGTNATASRTGDCDDSPIGGTEVNPAKSEVCDGKDNDCDGEIDEVSSPDAQDYFLDADGDGFGNVTERIRACGQPPGYTSEPGDCNDNEPRAFPGNDEVCDGIDNNCQSGIDEDSATDVVTWYEDLDGDGYGNKESSELSCDEPESGGPWVKSGRALDCNDADPNQGPCGCVSSNTGSKSVPLLLTLLAPLAFRRRRD